jgi:hypothetical protein
MLWYFSITHLGDFQLNRADKKIIKLNEIKETA